MARPINEFLLAWSSLSCDGSDMGWQAIGLSSSGILELRAGRRCPDNAEAVLVGFPTVRLPEAERLPDGQGFAMERANPEGGAKLWVALTRKPSGNAELFAAMVCDVVGSLDEAAANGCEEHYLLRIFVRRVGAWQEFMRKGAQPISHEAEVGLIGELELLSIIIESGVPSNFALESWVGPLGRIQDFELGAGAMEVKATLSTTGFAAKIGSLEQLDDSIRQPLYLAAIRMKQTPEGKTLVQFVESVKHQIKGEPESQRLLTDRLLAAGYTDMHADSYSRRFENSAVRLFEVSEDFPRLTMSSIPLGITRATYEIDLDKIFTENIGVVDALRKLGVI